MAFIFSLVNFVFLNVILRNANDSIVATALIAILFCIQLFTVNLLAFPVITKPLFIVLFFISASILYFMNTFGIVVDSDMIQNVFETHMSEALDLLTVKLVIYLAIFGCLPSLIVWNVDVDYQGFVKSKIILFLISLIATALIAYPLYQKISSFGRNNQHSQKLIVPSNFIYGTIRYAQTFQKQEFVILDENAKYVPANSDNKRVIVMIVGETTRSANWQLDGYNRPTNPLLSQQDIISFKKTASCGTSTAISVPCMFSSLTQADFDSGNAKNRENVLDIIARKLDVVWFDNDGGSKGTAKRVEYIEISQEDDPDFCDSEYCFDSALIQKLQDKLQNITQDTLIVLHTIGSHGPTYYKRYPPEFAKFQPACNTRNIDQCTREEVVNVYDNTVLYADFIVNAAIEEVKKYPQYESGLLFVSDHGESLGENGIFLHGLPYSIAPNEQKEVPFLFYANETMRANSGLDYECMKKKAAGGQFSQDYIFSTLLNLTQFQSVLYSPQLDILNGCQNNL
jgi:lipid A ethanolaminephosphotransferase